MTIYFFTKDVYGNTLIYLCEGPGFGPDQIDAVQSLTGKKTVSLRDLDSLRALGFKTIHVTREALHGYYANGTYNAGTVAR